MAHIRDALESVGINTAVAADEISMLAGSPGIMFSPYSKGSDDDRSADRK
jgi:hypothetical protein